MKTTQNRLVALLVIALAATAFAALAAGVVAYRARGNSADIYAASNLAFKSSLRLEAGITDDDSETAIVSKLTTLLYTRANFGGDYRPTSNDALRYMWTLHGDTRDYCSSLTSTLVWALALFDIPARAINIAAETFLSGKAEGDTHTFAEVAADGTTYLADPTFNTIYFCGTDGPLDAEGFSKCPALLWRYLTPPRPGRSLEEYYIPLQELTAAVDATARTDVFPSFSVPTGDWLEEARKLYK